MFRYEINRGKGLYMVTRKRIYWKQGSWKIQWSSFNWKAVKTAMQLLYYKTLIDIYENADDVKKILFEVNERGRPDLE